MKSISILGATGSIGTQTLDVIRNSKERINLIGITANSSVDKIKEIIQEFKPKYVGMMESNSAKKIKEYCDENYPEIQVFSGIEGLIKIATLDEIDTVVTSVVGMIGLKPTIAAIEAKKDIALANKETLVVAGELVMNKAKENNVKSCNRIDNCNNIGMFCFLGIHEFFHNIITNHQCDSFGRWIMGIWFIFNQFT